MARPLLVSCMSNCTIDAQIDHKNACSSQSRPLGTQKKINYLADGGAWATGGGPGIYTYSRSNFGGFEPYVG